MARARLLSLVLALGTLVLYLPVRHYGFITFDDPEYVTGNRVVRAGLTGAGVKWAFTQSSASNWHPVTWLSHMLDCEVFGPDGGAHHMISASLHAANAGLLLFVLFRMTGALWASALVAALFAFHPLRVESVAWISERKDVLSTLFFLLTLLAYTAYSREAQSGGRPSRGAAPRGRGGGGASYYVLALALFALGLMSKPMLVTLPFVLLLLDHWPLGRFGVAQGAVKRTTWGRLLREKAPFFALSAVSCVITYLAQRGESVATLASYPPGLRLGNSIVSCAGYLFNTVWPARLAVLYPYPAVLPWRQVVIAAAILAGVSIAAWRMRRDHPHLLIGWLWYLGTLVPVIGLLQVGSQAMADRYTYIPQIGVFIALAFEARFWLARWRVGPVAPAVLAGLALAACAAMTGRQLSFWKDSRTLFTRSLAVTADNAIARVNLGMALEAAGAAPEALVHYRAALRLDPALPQVHNNLGNILSRSGQKEEALEHYRESLRLKPRPLAFLNLGALLARMGKPEEALGCFTEAVRLDAGDPAPHTMMGRLALEQMQSESALRHFRDALRLDPNDVRSLVCAARLLAADENSALRNGPEAIALALRADALAGGVDPAVLDVLAMGYAENGRFGDAQDAVRGALERAQASGRTNVISGLQQRLELYRSGKPFRGASVEGPGEELSW